MNYVDDDHVVVDTGSLITHPSLISFAKSKMIVPMSDVSRFVSVELGSLRKLVHELEKVSIKSTKLNCNLFFNKICLRKY